MTSGGLFVRVGSGEEDYLTSKMVQCMLFWGILGRNKKAVEQALKGGGGSDMRVMTRDGGDRILKGTVFKYNCAQHKFVRFTLRHL